MNYVKVYTKTYRDNSARYIELPSLLIEQDGETQIFEQLLRYQIKYSHKSRTWHNKIIQAVGLLFDYMNANPNNYVSAKDFFELFAEAIYSGTIDEEGNDPSGLYWLPKKAQTANPLLSSLSDFSDWLYINYKTEQLNPWREATRYEERLKYMALINRSERSFLGHLDDIHDISAVSHLKLANIAMRTGKTWRGKARDFAIDFRFQLKAMTFMSLLPTGLFAGRGSKGFRRRLFEAIRRRRFAAVAAVGIQLSRENLDLVLQFGDFCRLSRNDCITLVNFRCDPLEFDLQRQHQCFEFLLCHESHRLSLFTYISLFLKIF